MRHPSPPGFSTFSSALHCFPSNLQNFVDVEIGVARPCKTTSEFALRMESDFQKLLDGWYREAFLARSHTHTHSLTYRTRFIFLTELFLFSLIVRPDGTKLANLLWGGFNGGLSFPIATNQKRRSRKLLGPRMPRIPR